MNRKSFLKLIGLGVVVTAIAPKVKLEEKYIIGCDPAVGNDHCSVARLTKDENGFTVIEYPPYGTLYCKPLPGFYDNKLILDLDGIEKHEFKPLI